MNEWLRKREYISPTIVDELIKSMVKTILRDTISDEATDVSGTEQVSVSVRWGDNCYEVHEDFLGLKELPDTKVMMTIHHEVKEFLIKCPLSIS